LLRRCAPLHAIAAGEHELRDGNVHQLVFDRWRARLSFGLRAPRALLRRDGSGRLLRGDRRISLHLSLIGAAAPPVVVQDDAQRTVRTPPARVSHTPEQLCVGRHAHDGAAPQAAGNGRHW
jgi:hypothetical protein